MYTTTLSKMEFIGLAGLVLQAIYAGDKAQADALANNCDDKILEIMAGSQTVLTNIWSKMAENLPSNFGIIFKEINDKITDAVKTGRITDDEINKLLTFLLSNLE